MICEEIGYALAPSPLLSSVSAALLLVAAGTDEQRERWLPALAAGSARGTVAVWDEHCGLGPRPLRGGARGGRVWGAHGDEDRGGGRGECRCPDRGRGGRAPLPGAGRWRRRVDLVRAVIDPTRKLYRVELSEAAVEPLSAGDPARIGHAYATIVTALAAENVGVAQRAMEMAVAYAKDRKQFDRPIGSYQAVAHRCAQMLLEVEGARSLSYWAAWALDHEPAAAPRAASMAKAYAGDAGFRVTASSLQVHGGIGFTWEHDLHFFLKRAKANAHAFGDARWHRDRVAALAGV